jgi:leucyl aminopeptidase
VPTFDLSTDSPAEVSADLLILPFYQGRTAGPGIQAVEKALGLDLMAALREQQVSGRVGDALAFPTFGKIPSRSLMLVGLGPRAEADADALRRALLKVSGRVAKFGRVASTLHQATGGDAESLHAFAEGLLLGTYRFDRYKHRPIDERSKEKDSLKKAVALLSGNEDTKAAKAALRRGRVYAEAANWARDLVNTPALDATPAFLADEATAMASKVGLECTIWTKAELQGGGFGGILGVGAGSINEPRLIELVYRGGGDGGQPIAITGKGVTFDSGGLSLKQPEWMETMKDDMGGAAAALAAMRAIGTLKPNVDVIAAIPSAENMPGGSAIRPGDVLRHYGGKTSEVLNTDAEGRLILADALAYLTKKNPSVIVDAATLTGAAMVALGQDVAAVIGSDQDVVDQLVQAGREEGEPLWQLPLWSEYRRHIESSVADVKNVGNRYGGAITAALFLKEFVGDVPWAHLDVAGTAFSDRGNPYWPRGATGAPARTFIRFVETQAERNAGETSASASPSRRGRKGS